MNKATAQKKISRLLSGSGIEVNGSNPGDIQIKYDRLVPFYRRVLRYGSLGLGESYMDKWWKCQGDKIDIFFEKIRKAGLDEKSKPWRMFFPFLVSIFVNLQAGSRGLKVAKKHYDLSTEMYESFLDPYNQYTCGYFENGATNLNDAQTQKMRLICEKLHLTSKDHLLDIGCGWGGFAKFANENYGCKVTGITISKEQANYARKFTEHLSNVQILEMNYKELVQKKYSGKFSKIVVCGMIEHVGYKNYSKFMKIVHHCLANEGIFLLQTIAGLISQTHTEPWIAKYIFPNSMLPSEKQLAKATEGLFITHDLQNFGPSYDQTLMFWYENFKRNFEKVKSEYYNERFYLMMEYYFLSCAGSFRARTLQEYHIVYSKNLQGKYVPIR